MIFGSGLTILCFGRYGFAFQNWGRDMTDQIVSASHRQRRTCIPLGRCRAICSRLGDNDTFPVVRSELRIQEDVVYITSLFAID